MVCVRHIVSASFFCPKVKLTLLLTSYTALAYLRLQLSANSQHQNQTCGAFFTWSSQCFFELSDLTLYTSSPKKSCFTCRIQLYWICSHLATRKTNAIHHQLQGYLMVFASICKYASTVGVFFCCCCGCFLRAQAVIKFVEIVSSKHFRKYNWWTESTS